MYHDGESVKYKGVTGDYKIIQHSQKVKSTDNSPREERVSEDDLWIYICK